MSCDECNFVPVLIRDRKILLEAIQIAVAILTTEGLDEQEAIDELERAVDEIGA